jgi:hypothetical protein
MTGRAKPAWELEQEARAINATDCSCLTDGGILFEPYCGGRIWVSFRLI